MANTGSGGLWGKWAGVRDGIAAALSQWSIVHTQLKLWVYFGIIEKKSNVEHLKQTYE